MMRESVDLPDPFGPAKHTRFALADGQVHAVERPGRAGVICETNIT